MAYADIMAKVSLMRLFDHELRSDVWMMFFIINIFSSSLHLFRVAILVRKKKEERKWGKMLRMRCPLRCDSQNW